MTEAKHALTRRNALIAAIAIGIMLGLPAGVGSFTFVYADGASYFYDDPAACANCHVMDTHYDAWIKSSHKNVATCNDCHTPKGLVPKYFVKAVNGWNHSVAFTTGNFPDPLQITKFNRGVTENACRACHTTFTSAVDPGHSGPDALSCIRCHSDVGHMY